jgi:hypothetical protein
LKTSTPLKDNNLSNTLERFARRMHPQVWIRDLIKNAEEAGATTFSLRREYRANSLGAARLIFSDDGRGMSAEDLKKYIGQWNSSSKTQAFGHHDNYGIGVKATTLPWNHYGVVFLSWTSKEDPGSMIWLHRDPETKRYGIKRIPRSAPVIDDETDAPLIDDEGSIVYDLFDDVVYLKELTREYPEGYDGIKWAALKTSEIKTAGHGTCVILCGNDRASALIKGHPHFGAHNTSIANFIRDRFYTLSMTGTCLFSNKHDTTRVKTYDAPEDEYWESEGILSWRIDGLDYDLAWGVTDEKVAAKISKAGGVNHHKAHNMCGAIVYYYNGELYNHQTQKNVMRSWGINHDKIIPRVNLIISMPARQEVGGGHHVGVYPDDTRSRLLWEDTRSNSRTHTLPVKALKQHFIDHMPAPIKQLLDEAFASREDRKSSIDHNEVIGKYAHIFRARDPRKKTFKAVCDPDGDLRVEEVPPEVWTPETSTGSNRPPNSDPKPATESNGSTNPLFEAGNTPASAKKEKAPKVQVSCAWMHYDADGERANSTSAFKGESKYIFPFCYAPSAGRKVILANLDHIHFRSTTSFFINQFRDGDRRRERITELIQDVYEAIAIAKVQHLIEQTKRDRKRDITEEASLAALNQIILGCYPAYEIIEAKIIKELKLSPQR